MAIAAKSNSQINTNAKQVIVSAKPAPIQFNTGNSAVIVIDMENDFCSKGGMFDRAGMNLTEIQKIITPTANVLNAARKAGIKIIYVRMAFKDDLSDLGKEGSPNRRRHLQLHVGDTIINPNGTKSRILIRNNWGTDIVSELKPEDSDIVLYKTRFGAFYNTDLDSMLQHNKINNLIIVGCTESICVESTVREAMFRDYSPIVLKDCTADPVGLARSNYDASILTIQALFGWVSTSDEFIKAAKNMGAK